MAIDIQKKAVGIVLAKRQMPKVTCEVKFALDISGSMQDLYDNGTVQKITDRCLAIASQFDDNGTLEAWTFTTGFSTLTPITESIHDGYVEKHILGDRNVTKWGGTAYEPVMRDIYESSFTKTIAEKVTQKASGFLGKLFGKSEEITTSKTVAAQPEHPVFVIFITDGETMDGSATERLLVESQKNNIYWMMIGIGREQFRLCRNLADKYDNVGFVHVQDVEKMSDEDFYLELLNDEFCRWAKGFARKVA